MKFHRWRKIVAHAMIAGSLVGGVNAAEPVSRHEGRMVIVREAGKPDRNCIVLRSIVQANGTRLHEVRNIETGEVFRIADPKPVGVIPVTPSAVPERRVPTTAELAGNPAGSLTADTQAIQKVGFVRKPKEITPPAAPRQPPATAQPAPAQPPAPVQEQLAKLRSATTPQERELAALTLTLGAARKTHEIIAALMSACRDDPAPAVRLTCIRCLFRLAPEAPQVVPILEERLKDKNVEVKKLARLALDELNQQQSEKERR